MAPVAQGPPKLFEPAGGLGPCPDVRPAPDEGLFQGGDGRWEVRVTVAPIVDDLGPFDAEACGDLGCPD